MGILDRFYEIMVEIGKSVEKCGEGNLKQRWDTNVPMVVKRLTHYKPSYTVQTEYLECKKNPCQCFNCCMNLLKSKFFNMK